MLDLGMALGADLAATGALIYGVYFRRHHRRDLVLAYIALNAGVLAVTVLLTSSEAGLGLGLGLFGILSIIRLRSDAITQEEIAYYFVSLALGLVNGLHPGLPMLSPTMFGVLIVVMYAADQPKFASTKHRQTVTLDAAYPDEAQLRVALSKLLNARVLHMVVMDLDMVRDTTVVDVRFRVAREDDHPRIRATGNDVTRAGNPVEDRAGSRSETLVS